MKAQIKRTNSGRYYLAVTAETTAEQLELTAMREQMRESGDVMHEFGGAARENDEVGRSLDYELNLLVREPVEPKMRPRHSLIAKLAGHV